MLKKILNKIKLTFYSIIYSMKGADDVISAQVDSTSKSSITREMQRTGAISDILQEKKTQQVAELVDESYRILKESEKYHVDIIDAKVNENGEFTSDFVAVTRKKTLSDFTKHSDVYDDGYPIKVIQDNKIINKNISTEEVNNLIGKVENYNYYTTLELKRIGFIPTFYIEKLATKIVVKEIDKNKSIVEIYLPQTPPQFGPIARSIINKLNKILNDKTYRSELIDISSIHFVTDHPWTDNGCHSLEDFEYNVEKILDVISYDGHIVVRYVCTNVKEYKYIGDKYKTKEVDEKYDSYAPKNAAVDVFAEIRLNKYKNKDDSSN